MHVTLFLSHFINGSLGNALLLALAIIICTFIIEDPTTVTVGMLASAGAIPIGIGLISLYVGIMAGDIGFYLLGRLARTHPRLERYVDHDFIAPLKAWIEERYILTIFIARFIPGARLPTYSASGFFRSSPGTFVVTVITAAFLWATALFFGAYWFNSVTAEWLGWTRWMIILFFLIVLFFVGRYNVRAIRARRDATIVET